VLADIIYKLDHLLFIYKILNTNFKNHQVVWLAVMPILYSDQRMNEVDVHNTNLNIHIVFYGCLTFLSSNDNQYDYLTIIFSAKCNILASFLMNYFITNDCCLDREWKARLVVHNFFACSLINLNEYYYKWHHYWKQFLPYILLFNIWR